MNTSTAQQGSVGRPFSLERGVTAFAGIMVLISVALTVWLHPGFVWLTVFVGANLFQQSFTGFCPAAMAMRRMGLRSEAEICGDGQRH
jgi:hypothetical protein